MLLHVFCRPGGALLTVSPLLLCGAAIPGVGLVTLPVAVVGGAMTVAPAVWAFFAFCLFLLGVTAYAFWRAAWSQQVRCWPKGHWLQVEKRDTHLGADMSAVSIAVTTRTVGLQGKVRLHEVRLSAREFGEPVAIHSGLTRWAAVRAAVRIHAHTGLSLQDGPPP